MTKPIIRSAERRAGPAERLDGLAVLFSMTSEQFCKLPECKSFKLELLDGEVVVMPRATPFHQYFVLGLAMVIAQWVKKLNLGRVLPDTLMMLDGRWTPAPDIVFVAKRHLKIGRAHV